MEAILEKLVESPRLSLYQRRISHLLEAEQARREQFIATVWNRKKIEFINGEVIAQSPSQLKEIQASQHLLTILDSFVRIHNLGFVGAETLMISLTRNDYEPDVCFFGPEKAEAITPDQMRLPAPDFIAEVLSESTAARDRGVKFDDYAAHGVQEYWIIDPDAEIVEQYFLDGDEYRLAFKVASGVLTSRAVEGFTIPVAAVFDAKVSLDALHQLLNQ